jgi:hypothetical protein
MDTAKQVPVITYHPKAANASLERLRRLSGVVALQRPVVIPPLWDDDEPQQTSERAND